MPVKIAPDSSAPPFSVFEILEASLASRRVIANHLHDTISQDLVALSFSLARLQRDPNLASAPDLTGAFELIDKCSSQVRLLSYALSPPALDDFKPKSTLAWYIGQLRKDAGIDVHFEASSEADDEAFSMDRRARTLICAAVQQWTQHALAQKAASATRIRLMRMPEKIHLEFLSSRAGDPAVSAVLDSVLLCETLRALDGCMETIPHCAGSSARLVFSGKSVRT